MIDILIYLLFQTLYISFFLYSPSPKIYDFRISHCLAFLFRLVQAAQASTEFSTFDTLLIANTVAFGTLRSFACTKDHVLEPCFLRIFFYEVEHVSGGRLSDGIEDLRWPFFQLYFLQEIISILEDHIFCLNTLRTTFTRDADLRNSEITWTNESLTVVPV